MDGRTHNADELRSWPAARVRHRLCCRSCEVPRSCPVPDEDADASVPMLLRDLLHQLVLEIAELESRIKAVEKHLAVLASQTAVVARGCARSRCRVVDGHCACRIRR